MTTKLLLSFPNNSVKILDVETPNGSIGRQFVRVGGTARTLCELNDPANQLISMPILVRESDCFSDNFFECADSLTTGNAWWVFYTIARREKELVRRLRAAQITCYCPQISQRHRSPAGRVRTSFVPLFGGYVFACGDEHDRHMALASNCVSRCLTVADGEELYRDLSQVWRLIAR